MSPLTVRYSPPFKPSSATHTVGVGSFTASVCVLSEKSKIRLSEVKRQAVLFAAAPSMLEALKSLIHAGHSLNPSSKEWHDAHAAIAAAEGAA